MRTKTFAFLLSIFILSGAQKAKDPVLISSLETFTIETGKRKVIFSNQQHFEAPNWSHDGKFIIYNSDGKIYRMNTAGSKPELINTSFAQKCNNDHGISPDNTQLVVSNNTEPAGKSIIYILPLSGGEPKQITPLSPSYWHGWSPDGKTLAYCAERNGEFDIYTIPVSGGEEKRLTSATGLDDGPDYTADGKYIYFNSVRTGKMKIWRMLADGTGQEQVTTDEYNDWFPHPSPDGKWLVFVSYEANVEGHPANKDVTLRLMPLAGGKPKVIAKLFGGQGTINVPSWSPDSKQFAFVSYKLIK
jgi:TolB protein